MHTFGETASGVPAFLAKLWRLVDDPKTNDLICWNKDGRSFIIQHQAKFARELLPLNYKHNNMASFIRQLNMYGFHKITSIENGGLKFDRDEMEFSHPCFKRNHPFLLEHIKRKIATAKTTDEKATLKPEAVTKVLQDVRAMRGRQDSLDSRFSVMKQENEALWREIASLRQKHAKQQQIVNKLIQFLITIVQPARNMTSVNRHIQLMINDIPENEKLRISSESESEPGGPVIHELGEELLDEVADSVGILYNTDDCASPSPLHMERPNSSISMTSQNNDYSNQSAEDLFNNMPSTPLSANGGQVSPSVIKSLNPDGSQVVYHVTEIPDAHPPEATKQTLPMNCNDDILQTPMVQKLIKQRNRRRKNAQTTVDESANNSKPTTAKVPRLQPYDLVSLCRPIKIKSEESLDPMEFLNVNTGSPATPQQQLQQLISPMLNDDSQQTQLNADSTKGTLTATAAADTTTTKVANSATPPPTKNNINNSLGLYSSDFIENDIPSDIFEDSSLLNDNSSNSNFNHKATSQQEQQLEDEQNFLLSTINNGKFSSYAASISNGNGASTSAAANVCDVGPSTSSAAGNLTTGNQATDNMAVTQYKRGTTLPSERLSSYHEVNVHLDTLQEELDSLKELLRNDGYSFDNSMLLSLFNDSDILGPYGMSVGNDGQNEIKGSELISYQPTYDLSDIMSINNESNLDTADADVASPGSSSVLNTPYHE